MISASPRSPGPDSAVAKHGLLPAPRHIDPAPNRIAPFPDTAALTLASRSQPPQPQALPAIELRRVVLPGQPLAQDRRKWPRFSLSLPRGAKIALCSADPVLAEGVLDLVTRRAAALAGTVCLDGRDIWLLSPAEIRSKIAWLPAPDQGDPEASLWQTLVREVLPRGCDWGEVHDPDQRQAITDALDLVGLGALAGAKLGSLASAQRLALRIALALVHRPGVLVLALDEIEPAATQVLGLLAGESELSVLMTARPGQILPEGVTRVQL
ncbi:hypothetical protein HOY34_10760 [Xinfangfangia sp. D13-10-4-6]|uniref:ATP-binding cassette domain-containing protein n=1 Tax=Pseudogemmobacter hezensis TaxID=2737662 RepID=UPI001557F2BA|nr:ATP-binding cassette domain-containing protein [Pseudogemmobacter hezensis]NPD15682.1 hypothetical protein [Pseudogemmobacter hezensis]